tara:strand:+ start:219 stop:518 length:300 start_codon:yes stop_codon:yes gene_type:complete
MISELFFTVLKIKMTTYRIDLLREKESKGELDMREMNSLLLYRGRLIKSAITTISSSPFSQISKEFIEQNIQLIKDEKEQENNMELLNTLSVLSVSFNS